MKTKGSTYILFFIALMLFWTANSSSAEYEAMQGIESTNAVFDFRIGDPGVALAHLNLIHNMLDDPNMSVNDSKPEIVVVFIGPSVKLVSSDQSGFDQDQHDSLNALADKISNMDQEGVKFEICMTSAPAFNVDPDSILPEVNKVQNGWISVVGYQHNGYAMVANF
jgi:uncharacterized protein